MVKGVDMVAKGVDMVAKGDLVHLSGGEHEDN